MANSQTVMALIGSANPIFRNKFDKIAFAIHSSFVSLGYVLTATGKAALATDAISSSRNEVGIDGWNQFDGLYAFVYANRLRTETFLVKCLGIDGTLVVDAIANGGSEPAHLEIKVDDYAEEYATTQFKDLGKLVQDFRCAIVSKLEEKPKPVSSSTQSSMCSRIRAFFRMRKESLEDERKRNIEILESGLQRANADLSENLKKLNEAEHIRNSLTAESYGITEAQKDVDDYKRERVRISLHISLLKDQILKVNDNFRMQDLQQTIGSTSKRSST